MIRQMTTIGIAGDKEKTSSMKSPFSPAAYISATGKKGLLRGVTGIGIRIWN